jgi:hypothetical protein
MSVPAYNKAFTPIKNLGALLRFMALAPQAQTAENATAQLLHSFAALLGIPDQAPTVVTTAGAGTYTAAGFATGLIQRDPNGAARTDTTPTAAQLIAGLGLTANYQHKFCTIHNNADAAETITLAGGTSVTLKGTITCEQSCVIRLCVVRTSSTTVAIRAV